MTLLGKTYLISGIASERSLAYCVAESLKKSGANLILSYQSERFKERLELYAETLGAQYTVLCDVESKKSIETMKDMIAKESGSLDGFLHSIAYAPSEQLQGNILDVLNYEDFEKTLKISAYSFFEMSQILSPLFIDHHSSLVTLTYIGSQRALPQYNVMGVAKATLESFVRYLAGSFGQRGIRVNGLSSAPMKTLAASGIKGFKEMLQESQERSLLKRNIQGYEIGEAAKFLLSPQSSALSGQIIYADGGFSVAG